MRSLTTRDITELAMELEQFVDKYGMYGVLQSLSEVCQDKAEHLSVNWQDYEGAKNWRKDATAIARLSLRLEQ